MKVLFIAPRSSYWHSQFIFCEPMGLSYVAAATAAAGHDVRIIQQLTDTFPSDDQIVETAREFRPDMIGISVLSDSYSISKQLVGKLRAVTDALVVYGGKHASINPDIASDDEVDLVVENEGERTFVEVLARYDGTMGSISGIKGLAYFDGELRRTGTADRIEDLDSLPFPMRDTLPMNSYRMVNIFAIPASRQRLVSCVSSRGCVYNCLFCPTPRLSQRKWFARSIENVIAEIDQMRSRYNPNYLLFHDEDVLLDRDRSVALCEAMIGRGFPKTMKWGCETNISNLDDGLLDLLERSGCVFLSFGIESGSEESLRKMRKRMDLEKVRDTLARVRRRMIQTNANIIIGFPWEDEKTILDGFENLKRMEIDTLAINVLIPIKGSDLYDIAVQENLLVDRDFHNWHQKQSVMNTRHIPGKEVDRLYRLLNRRFYFRLGFFWRLLKFGLRRPVYFLGMLEIFLRSIKGRLSQF